jgi:hypothetical protein
MRGALVIGALPVDHLIPERLVSFLPKPQTCFREAFALFGWPAAHLGDQMVARLIRLKL